MRKQADAHCAGGKTFTVTSNRRIIFAISIALICAVEMRQYLILFVQYPLYELVSEGLLRALHILK